MLIALENQKLVDAIAAVRHHAYQCPACQRTVILHHGTHVAPYFAHQNLGTCAVATEGETQQHILGKRQLAKFFGAWGPVTFEKNLPEIQQRADCWVARTQPVAVEFQCSPIGAEQVAQRTAGYRKVGAYPCWLLGERFGRQKIGWSLIDRFASPLRGWGLCLLFWDVGRQQIRVVHHLYQDATGSYGYWQSWVASLSELEAGNQRRLWVPPINVRQFRHDLNQKLMRATPALRPLQETLYLHGYHLAGFPTAFVTQHVTLPLFGQGLLVWRAVVGAWLFALRGTVLTPATIDRLAVQGLLVIGGHLRAGRFDGKVGLARAQHDFIQELIAAGYLGRVKSGWQINAEPQWAADYTVWLKNDEKKSG
ncbi:competence protein CoiA [Levilactobacillus enshiensis]|uniref:competence protein CoiA n=1 Tax=Levilactobacillus enshiensis TaxID=2590213 RepID=UPI00117BC95D|nr:competence protein CoiA family protein [Levilactobacillus enshiensis]